MTQEQREKLYHILGSIEGLTWGVEDPHISEGFCGVAEDLAKLLEDDAKQSEATGEAFIDMILKEGGKHENA